MRVVFPARAPATSRLALAARGLGLRGHALIGGPGDGRSVRGHADVALGAGRPAATARAAWLAGAPVLGLAVEPAEIGRWSWLDRWCWESADAVGFVEAPEWAALDPETRARLGLVAWSEEPVTAEPDATHADTEILERACERRLAARRGPRKPAVFLDRDGTLVFEKGYLADPEDLELLPGVPEALRELKGAGFTLVVVSNQSGVGRGFFPLARVYSAMGRLRELLRASGVELDAVYFCPHRPEAGCACRKPGTELLERAARDLGLSIAGSVMIGDKLLDARTGRRAGASGVLVRTGYGRDEEQRIGDEAPGEAPELVADDLSTAARWWIERTQARH